jgi:ribokinase
MRAVHPGGKGLNRAVAAARLGLSVGLLAAVGDDEAGRGLLDFLHGKGINTSLVKVVADTPTPVTAVIVSTITGEQAIIADKDDRMTLSATDLGSPAVRAAIAGAEVMLCTFEQPVTVLAQVLAHVRDLPRRPRLIVHASPPLHNPQLLYPYLRIVDYLVGTAAELDALVPRPESAIGDTTQRLRIAGAGAVCTLGNCESTVRSDDGDFDIPPFPTVLAGSPGAPAAFSAALAYRLLRSRRPAGEADFAWATAAMAAAQSLDAVPEAMPPVDRIDHIVALGPA